MFTIASLVFVTACFDPSNTPVCKVQCTSDADCTDGQTCGAGGLCSAGENCTEPDMCTAGEFIACVGDMARSCNATGDGTTDAACGAPGCNATAQRCNTCLPDAVTCSTDNLAVEQCASDGSATARIDTCAAGCNAGTATVAPHCSYISPAWLPDICDTAATIDSYAPNASATLTTTLDTNCTGGVIAQAVGSVCVVRAKTITIPNTVTLTINGTRPIAFVADTKLDVIGTLDASADGGTNGPGGGFRISGVAATATAAGGGAGFGGAGANGGSTSPGGGGAGGPVLDPITLSYLGGGARAGAGTGTFDPGGGGGGGAIMLVACRGQVNLRGTVDAGGGGGSPSYDLINGSGFQASKAAAGGGSGGYVVIQGLTVIVDGAIYANGGGGGGGNNTDDGASTRGGDGRRATTQAAGGQPGGAGATGGQGGALSAAATVGGAVTNGAASGGGGGGVGVLQIYTPTGVTPMTTGATVSPGFTAKKNSMVR
jgi:hypothetical protein